VTPADAQVVVLAGGYGTRLGRAGAACPKVMQPVAGRPFADILLSLLIAKGFRRFCFCLGHLAEQVVAHLERRWPRLALTYHVDDKPLGTSGSLIAARELLDERFLLVMGDTYLDIDYAALLAELSPPALGVMAVTDQVTDVPPNVQVSSGRVVRYDKATSVGASWVDTGALVLRRSALRLPGDLPAPADVPAPADLGVVLTGLIDRRALLAFPVHTPFYDIGTPDRLDRFEQAWSPGGKTGPSSLAFPAITPYRAGDLRGFPECG
jgi:NDP-sugar pyrophosphorylase family protein